MTKESLLKDQDRGLAGEKGIKSKPKVPLGMWALLTGGMMMPW